MSKPKLTLRDLFAVVTIVALAIAAGVCACLWWRSPDVFWHDFYLKVE